MRKRKHQTKAKTERKVLLSNTKLVSVSALIVSAPDLSVHVRSGYLVRLYMLGIDLNSDTHCTHSLHKPEASTKFVTELAWNCSCSSNVTRAGESSQSGCLRQASSSCSRNIPAKKNSSRRARRGQRAVRLNQLNRVMRLRQLLQFYCIEIRF